MIQRVFEFGFHQLRWPLASSEQASLIRPRVRSAMAMSIGPERSKKKKKKKKKKNICSRKSERGDEKDLRIVSGVCWLAAKACTVVC